MFAVIFVVQPKKDRRNDYLDLAKYLKPKLEAIDGFIDNERYESTRAKGRVLSLSTWRDEKAVVRWRSLGEHHRVQEKGRFEIFEDYRLRVGEVTDDTDPPQGLVVDEKRFDETEIGDAKAATIVEITPKDGSQIEAAPDALATHLGLDGHRDGCTEVEVFESIYNPGKLLILALWRDRRSAASWTPSQPAGSKKVRLRRVRIIRDYSMSDRREAPQFYPEVPTADRQSDRRRVAASR